MTFPANVERWRGTVENALSRVLANFPKWKSLQDRFLATISGGGAGVILAMIEKESSGNPWALGDPRPGAALKEISYWTETTAKQRINEYNSIGLMQLNWGAGTPQGIGYAGSKEGLLEPAVNIYWAVKYLFQQLERYQNLDSAVLAYNAGSYRTNAAGSPVNLGYLRDVLANLLEKKTFPLSFSALLLPGSPSAEDAGTDTNAPGGSPAGGPTVTTSETTQPAALEYVTQITEPAPDQVRTRTKVLAAVLATAGAAIIFLTAFFSSCNN